MEFSVPIFPIAYLPPVSWVKEAIQFNEIRIEQFETYPKQTIRNRCRILSSNGVQNLSIPVSARNHTLISEVETDETQNWRKIHWHTIESAYGKSPFFLFYRHKFEPIFKEKTASNLVELNVRLIQILFTCLKVNTQLALTDSFTREIDPVADFRNRFDIKKSSETTLVSSQPYPQVFGYKFDFVSDLSIIDLLFNAGPAALSYL